MLNRNRGMPGVTDQLTRGPGLAAQRLEYLQALGTGANHARGRALRQRRYERERPIKGGWRIENPRVVHYASKAGQNERLQGERFRTRGHAGYPARTCGMVRAGVLDMRANEDVHVRQQHPRSLAPEAIPGLVIPCVKCPRRVEVNSRAGMGATHRYQNERWRIRRLSTLQDVIQRSCNRRAYAVAEGFGFTAHLLCEPVVKGRSGPHDAPSKQPITSNIKCLAVS